MALTGTVSIFVILLVLAVSGNGHNKDSNQKKIPPMLVLNLDSSNFTEIINQHSLLLIDYYAGWCGFCKTLEVDLNLAAHDLVVQNIPARIAMVDATIQENEALAGAQGINGFPSLILYRNGQRVSDYLGGRSRQELVEYLRRKTGPPAQPITTVEEVERHAAALTSQAGPASITALAVGLFASSPSSNQETARGFSSKTAQVFLSAASAYDNAQFLITDSADIARHYNMPPDSMAVFTKSTSGLSGTIALNETMDEDNIIYSLLTYSIPPIIDYDAQTQPFLRSLLIKAHVLLFIDSTDLSTPLITHINQIAPLFRGRLVFITIKPAEHQLLQIFGLASSKPGDLPAVIVADMRDPLSMRRYCYRDYIVQERLRVLNQRQAVASAHEKLSAAAHYAATEEASVASPSAADWSPASLEQFFRQYLGRELSPSYFSENAAVVEESQRKAALKLRAAAFSTEPSAKSGTEKAATAIAAIAATMVETAVGTTFKQKVLDDAASDTLVYFFVPWCAHCKSFEPVLAELAAQMIEEQHLKFVRIDGSKNEVAHPSVRLRGFPSIYLFRANDKANPIEYDGERSALALKAFLMHFRAGGVKRGKDQDVQSVAVGGEGIEAVPDLAAG